MLKRLLVAFLSLVVLSAAPLPARADHDETYDRVMKTGVLRCGYFNWPPIFEKDVNTGEYRGFMKDIMDRLASSLSLKIEWTEELNFSNMFEGYGGRIDMICGPLAPTGARARASDFTDPMLAAAFYLYARADDPRFDNNYEAADDPGVTMTGADGEFSAIVAHEDFPKAKFNAVPQLSDPSQLLMEIATGKADLTATEPVQFIKFDKSNPGKLKRVPGPPVRILPLSLPIPVGEEKLKSMMNAAIMEMVETGFVDKALARYPDYDKTLLRLTPRFKTGEEQ